jgi:endonuclease/exonuclease/phosphatase family metal-dependent hydrolase
LTSGAYNATQSALGTEGALILFQEIDINANRSQRFNQVDSARTFFNDYGSVYASNFHTVWLQYPPLNPIGDIESGILTLSPYKIETATRRSLPVTDAFPTKFFDLDRCFEILRFPIESRDQDLVVVNAHLSAYDEKGEFKKQQLSLLTQFMREEAAHSNYVIVGGDFNNAFANSLTNFQNAEEIPGWIIPLDASAIPSGFKVIDPTNASTVGSVRDSSYQYIKGVNYETITDGWIVSDNIDASAEVIDTGYQYSDHNPVKLSFTLKPVYYEFAP